MATKAFGVKELKIDGSGTPTIESPSGGNLNLTAATSIFSGHISLGDSKIIKLGAAPDMSIFHDGTNGSINVATGSLTTRVKDTAGKGFYIEDPNGGTAQTIAKFEKNATGGAGRCELMYAGLKKFETTSAGVTITGDLNVTGSGGGGGGSTTFIGLTDTPANFTSQAGKYLKVNAGATALEYVTLPVDPDTNTTYSQSSVADGSNVKLRLTDSGSTNDDILLTAGTNISFSSVTAAGFTINHSGSAPASVVTDDNAPSSPSDGDLWWKSDEGRLKVYYADGSSDQWVDASPVLSPTSMTSGSNSISVTSTRSTVTGPLRVTGTLTGNASNNQLAYASHFIPDTNAAYDIGSAEYKVRHLFLSDNTVYFQGDFLKVAQHNSGGSAQSASYLIPLAKLKDALNASSDYESFKTAILAITDA